MVNNAKGFEVGFAPLPYYDDVVKQPLNSIIGGATLWTLKGDRRRNIRGSQSSTPICKSPEVQADWHQFSGYLPITEAAYKLGQDQGYYEKNPGADIGIKQLTRVTPTENSRASASATMFRSVALSTMSSLPLSGKKTAKEALDSVVSRGNEQLRDFQSSNQ